MSDYSGHVEAGGAAATRELPGLVITKVAVGSMDNNAYLLRDTRTGDQLLIDAPTDAPRLLEVIGDGGLRTLVTTHAHRDHWQALTEVAGATGARTAAHPIDAAVLPVEPDVLLQDGDVVNVGEAQLEVLHIPGHSPGLIALLYRDPEGSPHLFATDALFPGGPGGTNNPQDFDAIMTALETKVFDRLPDETWVYPGHGDDTTLGRERPHLGEWRARGW
jgi:glyoxylase-like metal-dependent hydrolase (beta-lactamase superfamily II)